MSASPRKQHLLHPSAVGPFLVFKSPHTVDSVFRFYELEALTRWIDEFGELGIRVQVAGQLYKLPAEFEATAELWSNYVQGKDAKAVDS